MLDRTDLDALLIGALYGELTPADEARLMAHLESHPADRTALADLTRTRAAVRDSRILAVQLEPPQAISALLLQEASRRAPRAVTDRGEVATWFQRFVRSFMAHPAMAAAATLVLVITAAGTLYLHGTDQFAKSESPSAAAERIPTSAITTGAAAPSAAPAAPAPEPVAPSAEGAPGQPAAPAGAPARSSAEVAAGSGAYKFDGAPAAASDATVQDPRTARQAAFEADRVQDADKLSARAPYEKAKASGQGFTQDSKLRAVTRPAPAKAAKAEAVHGIELRSPELQPKDLGDDEKPAGRRGGAGEVARDQRNAAAVGGGAPASPPASAPPPPPAPASAPGPSRASGPAGAADFDVSQTQQAPAAHEAKRPAPKPSANQQQSAPSANNAANAQTDRRLGKTANAANTENTVNGDARQAQTDRVLEWARKQREQVIAYVNANRCHEAATAAVEIYNRAPEYYNANVATDRLVKPCLAYVTGERERADRSRASNKNAADVQPPAQAAPTRK